MSTVSEYEIENPITRKAVPVDDADALIELVDAVNEKLRELYDARDRAALALAEKAEGTGKTRYVRGYKRVCKVEMPATSWDNARLKEAWYAYPALADEYLRVERIAPRLREVEKLRNTSGPPDFEQFKQMVLGAEREPTAPPRIKVEG